VNKRSMQRLARFGSGWIPWGDDAEDIGTGIEKMRAAVSELGRDPSDLGVVGNLMFVRNADGEVDVDATMAKAPAMAAAGVTDFRLYPMPPRERAGATAYLTDLVSRFRAATH
jgi:alkanesulfonate monooxygenase SsuD/methylene tetrahydromethanopterin reductase-like flavin-dependent oxidoreductase (luciferase family)